MAAVAAIGNVGLLALTTTSPLWIYLLSTAVAGMGYGVIFSIVSDVVVGSVPVERSGAASGISETSFELGTALGLALLGSLATLVFRQQADGRPFGDTLGETLHSTREMGSVGNTLADAARQAFVDGLHAASLASVLGLGALAVVLAVVMRRRRVPAVR